MKKISIVAIAFAFITLLCSCSRNQSIRFDDFVHYKDSFSAVAERLIADFRTSSDEERFFIEINNASSQLIAENGDEITLSNQETEALNSIIRLQLFDYIIVGNTYVSYTKFGTAYAIVYSEDDVKPKGSWKYTKDVNVSISKLEACWYEIKANGD